MSFDANMVVIVAVAVATCLTAFFICKKDLEPYETEEENIYSISYLSSGIKNRLNEIVNQNLVALYLNKKETDKRREQKKRLTMAIRSCAQGNQGEKAYMIDYIKDLLQSKLGINEETIDHVIPFHNPELLNEQDKFEILLQAFRMDYGCDAFRKLNELCSFEQEKLNEYGVHYEVDKKDINTCYRRLAMPLSYVLKLEIIAQRVFQEAYGFGCVDEILYQNSIDGVSGGNSGTTNEQYNYMEEIMQTSDLTASKSYESIWIILHGKPIHLSFLSFGGRAELIRVCKNLYLYDNVGHLTSSNGYKLSYLQNGSRVVVTRPKLTSGWAFFVRKFDSVKALNMKALLQDNNNDTVIELVIWMVKGLLNIIISGDQNSGKTTFLKCLFQYMDQRYEIRTTEEEFELWLNSLYTKLSSVAFRGTEEVSLIDAINIQKKTNGVIMVLGEITDARQANAYISLTQSGTKCTYGTCHCVTTEDMIDYFRNAALSKDGSFNNEMAAEEQIANSINIDIHWEKSGDGHRYISHVTEIIPLPRNAINTGSRMEDITEALKVLARRRAFETREIVVLENGRYVFKNQLSDRSVKKILKNLRKEDAERFLKFNEKGGAHDKQSITSYHWDSLVDCSAGDILFNKHN